MKSQSIQLEARYNFDLSSHHCKMTGSTSIFSEGTVHPQFCSRRPATYTGVLHYVH